MSIHTIVLGAEVSQDTWKLLRCVVQSKLSRKEGTFWIEEITALVHESSAVEHVNTAQEEVMRIDQVIIDLGILTCVYKRCNKLQ